MNLDSMQKSSSKGKLQFPDALVFVYFFKNYLNKNPILSLITRSSAFFRRPNDESQWIPENSLLLSKFERDRKESPHVEGPLAVQDFFCVPVLAAGVSESRDPTWKRVCKKAPPIKILVPAQREAYISKQSDVVYGAGPIHFSAPDQYSLHLIFFFFFSLLSFFLTIKSSSMCDIHRREIRFYYYTSAV